VRAVGLKAGAWADQVHGDVVARAEQPGCVGEADALWTSVPGLGVVGRSADCPLILVAGTDRKGRGLWGMAHASWRSTAAGITSLLLREMIRAGMEPASAQGIICPSAGPCCYQVGPEVRDEVLRRLGPVAKAYLSGPVDHPRFDLWLANGAQWEAAGLPGKRLRRTGLCTLCGDGTYPSHRREQGQAGRFGAASGGLA
jgi:copper oxidase (laccase) domain-containing protein